MAPQVGFEPTTLRLTAECSTIELLRSNRQAFLLHQRPARTVNFSETLEAYTLRIMNSGNPKWAVAGPLEISTVDRAAGSSVGGDDSGNLYSPGAPQAPRSARDGKGVQASSGR